MCTVLMYLGEHRSRFPAYDVITVTRAADLPKCIFIRAECSTPCLHYWKCFAVLLAMPKGIKDNVEWTPTMHCSRFLNK